MTINNTPRPTGRRFAFGGGLGLIALLLSRWISIGAVSGAELPVDADRLWQNVLEQAGGPGTRFRNAAEAMAAARGHLDKQEATLRDFGTRFPADGRRYSARIRLSGVLAAKAQMSGKSPLREEARKLLSDLEDDPATPAPVKGDAAFARISQSMENMARHADRAARSDLTDNIHRFDNAFPADRRTAGLLAEVATLYDAEPAEKRSLLDEARAKTNDESMRRRIADDLRRLDLLGKPLELRLQPWQGGAPIDLSSHRGRVVVLVFWASWSGPALKELAALLQTAYRFAGRPVDFLSVSLDADRAALAATIKAADLAWPTHCDGKGWRGDVVESLGINAVPTVFVLDRKGNLITLNARGGAVEEIERALLAR